MLNRLPVFLLLSTVGCDALNPFKSTCEQFYTTACDECSGDDWQQDVLCACLEGDEVKNAKEFFQDRDEAEIFCADLKIAVSNNFGGHEAKETCGRELELLNDFGDDTCDYLGWEKQRSYDTGGW